MNRDIFVPAGPGNATPDLVKALRVALEDGCVTLESNLFDNALCTPDQVAVTISGEGASGRFRRHRSFYLKGNRFLHCQRAVDASSVAHLIIEP